MSNHYDDIRFNAAINQSLIQEKLYPLSKTVTSTRSRKVKASQTMGEVITATQNVIKKYTIYIQNLKIVADKVRELLKPKLTFCNATRVILGPFNSYIKTACFVTTPKSNYTAQMNCQMNDMPALYAIRNEHDFNGLKNAADEVTTELFGSTLGKTFLINGKQDSNGNYYNFNPLRTSIYQAAVSAKPESCLFFEGISTTLFSPRVHPCTAIARSICYTVSPVGFYDCNNFTNFNANPFSTYRNSVCLTKSDATPSDSSSDCKSAFTLGLMVVDSDAVLNHMQNYAKNIATQLYGQFLGSRFIVDGRLHPGDSWSSLNTNLPMILAPTWRSLLQGSSECLAIEGTPTGQTLTTVKCTDSFGYICEFKF